MTQAELNFLEGVPRTLKEIAKHLGTIAEASAHEAAATKSVVVENIPSQETKIDLSNLNPTWDEERKAVFIPIINKYLDAKHSEKEMTWDEAMAYAKKAGKELPSQHEMFAILFFKDEINAILKEHGGDLLTEWAWASTEFSASYAWVVLFNIGYVGYAYKYVSRYVRAVAAI